MIILRIWHINECLFMLSYSGERFLSADFIGSRTIFRVLWLVGTTVLTFSFIDVVAWVIIWLLICSAWVGTWTLRNMFFYNCWGVFLINCSDFLIVIITVEKSLNTVSPQKHRILPHLVCVVIFPLAICIFGIKVVLLGWNERWFDFAIKQLIPIITFKPDVIFYLLRSIKSQTIDRLSLD